VRTRLRAFIKRDTALVTLSVTRDEPVLDEIQRAVEMSAESQVVLRVVVPQSFDENKRKGGWKNGKTT